MTRRRLVRAGETIARIRRLRDLTQPDLALALGVHRNTLGRWERGETAPPLDMLGPLCRALRVRPEVFVDLPLRGLDAYFTD